MSAQDFIQDTDEFFDDFAEQATLDGVPIWGVPDEEFVDVNGHEEKRPTFIVPTKGVDIPHIQSGRLLKAGTAEHAERLRQMGIAA